jgi:adenosylcobinamide kinase/adenosylcobinamide-phosphate guanylyltransferase
LSFLIFITGGARSGKSKLALQLAERAGGKVAFIATARAEDDEMAERILIHQESRPKEWTTIEEPVDVPGAIAKVADHDLIIMDCLTLLLSNLMLDNSSLDEIDGILGKMEDLVKASRSFKGTVIVVSNEVGMGIVPENELARKFRDLAGRANQIMAKAADEVYLCVSGVPVNIKG